MWLGEHYWIEVCLRHDCAGVLINGYFFMKIIWNWCGLWVWCDVSRNIPTGRNWGHLWKLIHSFFFFLRRKDCVLHECNSLKCVLYGEQSVIWRIFEIKSILICNGDCLICLCSCPPLWKSIIFKRHTYENDTLILFSFSCK